MANKLKVGQVVQVPDGRVGRVLYFIGTDQVTVLFGKKADTFQIDQLVAEPNNQPEHTKQY
jgi:hypothetical protein